MGRARLFVSVGVLVSLVGLTHMASPSEASVVIEQIGSDIDGEAADDYSGYSVSLSADGTKVAIGAYANDGNGNSSGHVRIYSWNGTSWTQLGSDIDGEAAGDQSGFAVSLSADGTKVAIGAPGNDGNGNSSGHVRIYSWNGTSWTQLGSDIDGEAANDYSGTSVSLSADGTTVAIGAYANDGNGNGSGHVRIYSWNGTTWVQVGSDIDGEAAGDQSGISVSMSADGTTVAIGAWQNVNGNSNNSGHVRIYQWNASTTSWTQLGSDIDGEAAGDYSGYSVSLSADGTKVAIGAPGNDSNGNGSGRVRIYQWNASTTSWTQLGSDIDGEAAGDQSGHAVSLSADGTTVAIGANSNDGNGFGSGHIRLFSLSTITPPAAVTPVTPIWRVSFDPNGGSCVDNSERTETWTSVFVGYRYLPNATGCTRPGFTFTGWATATDPSTPVTLPVLVDPSDNQRRAFLAANADLIAMWTPNPTPITDVTVFANFMCGPCTNLWLIHPPVEPDTTIDITVNNQPTTCSTSMAALGLTFCELTPLSPGDHTITLTPRHDDITGTPTRIPITLMQ